MRIKNRARSFMQVRRSRSKRGVSPVIGVILMVAATIVIAGVVMGMLGGFGPPKPTKTVMFSTSRINTTYVDLTVTAIEPAGTSIKSLNLSGDVSDGDWVKAPTNVTIGKTYTVKNATSPAHIVITAEFGDGTKQVVFDSKV